MHASMTLSQILDEAVEPHRAVGTRIEISCSAIDPDEHGPQPTGERHPGLLYGLGNLIENAVDFASTRVDIAARWSDTHVSVVITDDGPGFAPEVFESIGDPYVTTRPSRRTKNESAGLGLGFFIAKTLLERSGASMEFENQSAPATGAIVRVTWPRSVFEHQTAEAA